MKAQWERLCARFDALLFRERALVALALVGGIVFLGHVFFVEPQLLRAEQQRKRMAAQQAELAQLQAQVTSMEGMQRDPDAANRAALERMRADIGQLDGRLKGFEQTLVPPDRVAALLEDMLKRNRNLRLVALRTLPVSSVIERKEPAKASGEAAAEVPAGTANLFRHGVEITIQGSYGDLLDYIAQAERLSGHLFWSSLNLAVREYPRTTLTLTVYTMSLDKTWLVV